MPVASVVRRRRRPDHHGGRRPTTPPAPRAQLTSTAGVDGRRAEVQQSSGRSRGCPRRRRSRPCLGARRRPRPRADAQRDAAPVDTRAVQLEGHGGARGATAEHLRARASILKEDYFQRLSLQRDATARRSRRPSPRCGRCGTGAPSAGARGGEERRAFVMSCLVGGARDAARDAKRAEYSRTSVVHRTTAADRAARGRSRGQRRDRALRGGAELPPRATSSAPSVCASGAMRANPEAGAPLAPSARGSTQRSPRTRPPRRRRSASPCSTAPCRPTRHLEQAFYWRGLLHKRIDSHSAAMGNFRKRRRAEPEAPRSDARAARLRDAHPAELDLDEGRQVARGVTLRARLPASPPRSQPGRRPPAPCTRGSTARGRAGCAACRARTARTRRGARGGGSIPSRGARRS